MTPPDGADFPHSTAEQTVLTPTHAILLRGGRALLLFEGLDTPPPRQGRLPTGTRDHAWTAECWRAEEGDAWCGLALTDALPAPGTRLVEAKGPREWRLAAPSHVDISPRPLADLVRKAGVDSRAVFGFLVTHLLDGQADGSADATAHHAFAAAFFTATAERDGFIEILANPEGGGLFAQGWSLSLDSGPITLVGVAGDIAPREVEVALFDREDILPPGQGFCLFGKHWRDTPPETVDAVFFEHSGRLLRLDVVQGGAPRLTASAATAHVADMLPRLRAPRNTQRAFKRICRPVFNGIDTLSQTTAPIAAACDHVLRAPDGTLLILGWLLDPLRRVDRVILKSTANLYAPINLNWCALPRPDLNTGFGADPRFADKLDSHDILHGFIASAQALPAQTADAQVYLELVLDDDTCLFRPLRVTAFDSAGPLPSILAALSPNEPELGRIVTEHLTPFLASVRPASQARRPGAAVRPIPLGTNAGQRDIAAVIPFRAYAELQPILGLLAGTPEAEQLDLTLVATRAVANDALTRITDAFTFYGLSGSLILAPESETIAARLDTGAGATTGRRVLAWMPGALPRARGWLDRLLAEADALPRPGLISPALIYEDGSICFGGDAADPIDTDGARAFCGYGANWLPRGAPRPVFAAAAEIALIDRDLLTRVGGFAGHLFSDAFSHLDLAARLRRAGHASYCSGLVEFWMLDDPHPTDTAPFARLMRQVDAALLDRRRRDLPGDIQA